MIEPQPTDPHWPRYSARPFPAYRFIPGQTPHPRRHPHGHSYGRPEPRPVRYPADCWRLSEDYLYGIDLYNFAYWWECHEAFEGLWHAAGHESEQGRFFQAFIQLAAAQLKRLMHNERAAANLLRKGIVRLTALGQSHYMGVNLSRILHAHETCLHNPGQPYPLIGLEDI